MLTNQVQVMLGAVDRGDEERVRVYLDRRNSIQKINQRDWHGRTPLMRAIFRPSASIVRMLLEIAPEEQVTTRDYRKQQTALMHAIRDIDCLRLLLEHVPEQQVVAKDKYGHTALMLALSTNDTNDVVATLLNWLPARQVVEKNNRGVTALMFGMMNDKVDGVSCIQALFAHSNPEQQVLETDHRGQNALMWAMRSRLGDTVGRVEMLLKYAPEQQVLVRDRRGETALMQWVRKHSSITFTEILLRFVPEEQVMMRNERGQIALMLAIENPNVDNMRLLLKHVPDWQINARDNDGTMPLMYAMSLESHASVLLEYMSEEQIQEQEAMMVVNANRTWYLDSAARMKNIRLVRALLLAGASLSDLSEPAMRVIEGVMCDMFQKDDVPQALRDAVVEFANRYADLRCSKYG